MSDDELAKLFHAVAEAIVRFTDSLQELAKPLSDDDVRLLVARCRREAYPSEGHTFLTPVWDWPAELLERELLFRAAVDRLEKVRRG